MDKELLKYFKGDKLAASTWLNKYAAEGEITPNDMHKRMAKEFARIESNYPNPISELEIYNMFKDFKYIIPGGSVMSGCGTNKLVSLSNCFVTDSPKDSYDSIMTTRNHQVQLMKRRGGVGYDLSKLRPRGAAVNNAANTSTGAASFMDVNSDLTNETAQNGRRGALMLSVSINHPDVEEFITKKQDLTKVTGANISVKVTDEFMTAVENDTDYILSFPVNIPQEDFLGNYEDYEYNVLKQVYTNNDVLVYTKKIRARELWNTLMHCAWNTAEPGILFESAIHNYSPDGVYDDFKAISTNPCQPAWATVLTPEGISTIGEIVIGDKIWSSEGWTTIVNKQCTGIKEVHEYKTTAGSFIGTDNHRIVSNGVKIEAKDAESIDALDGNRFTTSCFELDPQDIVDGLVLGDGSVHKASDNLVYLCIGEKDGDYFTSNINSLIGKCRKSIHSYAFEIVTNIKHTELPLTYLREIPERYFKATPFEVAGFLRGLYSANGSVVGNRVTFKTASSKLRDQVQILLSSLGIRSYYTTNKPKEIEFSNGTYTCKESYDINISTDRAVFYNYIGFLQRYKMKKLNNTIKKVQNTIKNHSIISDTIVSKEAVYSITVDNKTHTYWTGGLNVSNCGEIPMGANDSCRLIHINLTNFIKNPFTPSATLDSTLLENISYKAMKLADDLIDLELENIDKLLSIIDKNSEEYKIWNNIKHTTIQGRRAGVGFTGLADAIAMLNLKYDSDKSICMIENIMDYMFKGQLDAAIDMAKDRGCFPAYNRNLEDITQDRTNKWFKFVFNHFPREYNLMRKYGRRNISFSTVAPTGTVSIMAQCSSGIEPVFMPFYERKRKCMSSNDRVDFTDKLGINYSKFIVVHPKLKEWVNINWQEDTTLWNLKDWQEAFEDSPYCGSTANDISWRQRVKLQGVIQKYITHSISSTINLPKETTQEEIADIYLEAWKAGNKGQTIYRDGCREGVLTSVNTPKTIEGRQSPKRPDILEADFYTVKVKGEQFTVLVGLLDNNPYEVFTFRLDEETNIKPHKGKITRNKKKHYSFDSEYINIKDIQLANDNIEEKAATLYSSMLLRHGTAIPYIVKTAKKVNENISSFSSAMCRILSKYIDKDTIEGIPCPECGEYNKPEGGCYTCKSCGYSRCS